jgi:hypothetical protein
MEQPSLRSSAARRYLSVLWSAGTLATDDSCGTSTLSCDPQLSPPPPPPPFHPIPPHSYPMSPHFYPRLEMAVTPLSPHPSMVSVMDFLSLATRLLTADGSQPQKHKTQRFSRCEYLPMFAIAQSCILSTYEIDGPQAELLYKQRAKHGNNASPANLR